MCATPHGLVAEKRNRGRLRRASRGAHVRQDEAKAPASERNFRSLAGLLSSLQSLSTTSLRRKLLKLALYSLVAGLSQAALLVLISELAVNGVQGKASLSLHGFHTSVTDALLVSVVLLVVFAAGSMRVAMVSSAAAASGVQDARGKVIDAYFETDWSEQSAERLGHIQQLLTVNCESVGQIIQFMTQGLQALLFVAAMLVAAFVVDPVASAIVLGAGVLLSTSLRPFLKWNQRASARLSASSRRMATLVTEFTTLTREIRLLGVQQEAVDQLHLKNHEAALNYRSNRRIVQIGPVFYQTFALAFIVGGLAILVHHGHGNVGATGAVVLLTLRALTFGAGFQTASQQLRSYEGYLDGIELDIARYRQGTTDFEVLPAPASFDLEFDDVSFSYGGTTEALSSVSFRIPDGTLAGVVGRSGSGKSTLSQLALGMRPPSKGSVRIGTVPATAIEKAHGKSPIALVAQDSILLQGSIASNIAFFRDVTQEQIELASRAAHLHEDVESMVDGYDTLVGEGGGSLSGGQRQRLAIARALVGSPRLLVLDEPTSALDARSENLIRRTLAELRGRVTVVVISHRLNAIEDCDLLLVLQQARQVDFGPRTEVMDRAAFKAVADEVAHEILEEDLTPAS
jgi:ATP-binding cassette, subfamily B, bacterial